MANKVLIAEDDKFLANAYRVKLQKEGFEAVIAEDGEKAMEAINTTKFDLIILDLIMPKKDGFETLEEIKSNPAMAKIPVLIASNLGQKEDIDRGMELGATDYIVKSDMSMEGLVNKINELIS